MAQGFRGRAQGRPSGVFLPVGTDLAPRTGRVMKPPRCR